MTCGGCASKVKSAFLRHPDVFSADVNHHEGIARIEAGQRPKRSQVEKLLAEAGEYRITAVLSNNEQSVDDHSYQDTKAAQVAPVNWETYKPLVLIFVFVAGTAALASFEGQSFSWLTWMRYFMAGFFIVFSFFKFLDLKGFARSYAMYDLLGRQWKGYGYIYPFLELALGILYLTAVNLTATHLATIVIMGFSSVGVIRNMLSPNQVQCACLGTVFKLPLGRVTLVEDLLMVGMAGVMLVL